MDFSFGEKLSINRIRNLKKSLYRLCLYKVYVTLTPWVTRWAQSFLIRVKVFGCGQSRYCLAKYSVILPGRFMQVWTGNKCVKFRIKISINFRGCFILPHTTSRLCYILCHCFAFMYCTCFIVLHSFFRVLQRTNSLLSLSSLPFPLALPLPLRSP